MTKPAPGQGEPTNAVDGRRAADAGGRTPSQRYADEEIKRAILTPPVGTSVKWESMYGSACERIYDLQLERDILRAELDMATRLLSAASPSEKIAECKEWARGFGIAEEDIESHKATWLKLRAEFLKAGR